MPRVSKAEARNRDGLVDRAQLVAIGFAKPYRAVVIVTDEAGDFVGVGMNTSLDDAIAIMKCALYADGLVFHETPDSACLDSAAPHSRSPKKSRAARKRRASEPGGMDRHG